MSDIDFLIVGLGNPEPERKNTRHNIGYLVADSLLECQLPPFDGHCERNIDGKRIAVIKPITGMNSIGEAVVREIRKLNLSIYPADKILVIVDDLSLPFGEVRLKMNGSSGGHNGLKSIEKLIGINYPRIKFGIGNNYEKGKQLDYVLGEWTDAEMSALPEKISAMKNKIVDYIKNAK